MAVSPGLLIKNGLVKVQIQSSEKTMDPSGHTLVLNMKLQWICGYLINNCDVRFAIFTTAMHT